MRFYANRGLYSGDEITITYLPALWRTNTRERRRRLLHEKLFFCQCSRCKIASTDIVVPPASNPVDALVAMECAAAGCKDAEGCPHRCIGRCEPRAKSQHPPCPELVGEATTAFLSCCQREPAHGKDATTAARELQLAQWIGQRYMQWAILQFGEQDSAVRTMRALLKPIGT